MSIAKWLCACWVYERSEPVDFSPQVQTIKNRGMLLILFE